MLLPQPIQFPRGRNRTGPEMSGPFQKLWPEPYLPLGHHFFWCALTLKNCHLKMITVTVWLPVNIKSFTCIVTQVLRQDITETLHTSRKVNYNGTIKLNEVKRRTATL